MITIAAAVKALKQQFGANVSLTEIEIDARQQPAAFTLEAVDAANEYHLTHDARSGKVLTHAQEPRDDNDDDAINPDELASLTAITTAATQAVPGDAYEWALSRDDGIIAWEVTIQAHQSGTAEVQVQADTAPGLSHEFEDDD